MSVIRNLQTDEKGWFTKGVFDSDSLFQCEMQITIDTEAGATVADAEACIRHYSKLKDQQSLIDDIEKGLSSFFEYMYHEWRAFEAVYGDIADSLEPVMEEYQKGAPLLPYLYEPKMYVDPQKEGDIVYGIVCECPWEPEHACQILIRNDKVVYVGPAGGNTPWDDEDEYYCIWNDEE